MQIIGHQAATVLKDPAAFAWRTLRAFRANQGLLLAGAVAYYAKGRPMSKSFWALIATLVLVYVGNILGPPPPSTTAIIASMVAIVPLVWWWGNKAAAPA